MPIHVHYWCKHRTSPLRDPAEQMGDVDEVAHQGQISHNSAYEIIYSRLAFHKVCAQWVPKQLTEFHKEKCLYICQWLLDPYGAEGDHFLERIVMGDEKWVHHYEPESKHQRMEWKHHHLSSKNMFKMHPTTGKLMLSVFWDSLRLLLKHYQERGSAVKSVCYSEMLCNKLKCAIQSK